MTAFCEQCGQPPEDGDRVLPNAKFALWLCGRCYDAIMGRKVRPRRSPRAEDSSLATVDSEALGTKAKAKAKAEGDDPAGGKAGGVETSVSSRGSRLDEDADGDGESAQLWELLRAHREEGFMPEPFDGLGPLPPHPSRAERAAHDFIRLCFGLRLADGTTDPLPLARSVLVAAGIVRTAGGASKLMRRLEEAGVWYCAGHLPPFRGRPVGTKTWLPGRKPVGLPEPEGGWRVVPASDWMPGAVFERASVAVEAEGVVSRVAVEPAGELPHEPEVRGARSADALGVMVAAGDGAAGRHAPDVRPGVGGDVEIVF